MPPIPSPLFTEAKTSYEGISRRLKDLGEYQIPRLRDCKGPLTLQQQFAAELRDDTESIAKRLEDFSTLAEDQERENERTEVKKWVNELFDELTRLKSESRAALLASKRAIDGDARSRRDELLGSAALHEKRAADAQAHKQQATDDKLMAASNDVTEALRRTTRLMQQELERSVLSTQMLQESSKTLRATSDSYTTIDGLMDVSQALVKALQRADWVDRIIIGLSLGVFVLTAAYIVKRRVLDRVISVATLPLKLVGSPRKATESLTNTVESAVKYLSTTTPSELTSTLSSTPSLSSASTLSSSTLSSSSILSSSTALSSTLASPTDTASLSEAISSSLCSEAACSAPGSATTTALAASVTDVIADAATRVLSTVETLLREEL